ncbi:unnamed protein product [Somion occarium]|uniref:Uncharacterized protein n=1 Tax=Somion occarium TaxID=3059160 RepID=A0ABP1CZ99_9APHY
MQQLNIHDVDRYRGSILCLDRNSYYNGPPAGVGPGVNSKLSLYICCSVRAGYHGTSDRAPLALEHGPWNYQPDVVLSLTAWTGTRESNGPCAHLVQKNFTLCSVTEPGPSFVLRGTTDTNRLGITPDRDQAWIGLQSINGRRCRTNKWTAITLSST